MPIDDNPYSKESILALATIPSDTPEGRGDLENVAWNWLFQLEQVKWPRGLQWFENVSYLQGNHLTRFYYNADIGFGFHHGGAAPNDTFGNLVAKSADNRLIRPVETVVGMLVQSKPHPRVEPNSSAPEDEDAAELSQIVLNLLFERPLNLAAKIEESAYNALITGTAAVEVEYGETDRPVVIPKYKVREKKHPLYPDQTITEVVQDGEEVEMRKDIMARCWSAYHIFPDPVATKPEEMTWVARTTFEDIDWIRESFSLDEEGYFPENLEDIEVENATKHILYWYAKFNDVIESPQYYQHGGGLAPQTFNTKGGYAPNQVLFTVFDVKPSRTFPRGRTLIFAGRKIIYAGDARAWSEQYPDRWHPYAFLYWFKIPGKFWGIPLLSELVPLQKKINAIDALVQANRHFMALGQWKLPKHAKVAEGRISGIPGEHLTYTAAPGMPQPERVVHPPLPAELLAERDQLIQSIDHISASGFIEQISKSAARSGPVLDFMRQEKMRGKAPFIQGFERFLETIAQNILIEIQLNLLEEDEALTQRIVKAARDHSSIAIDSFTGESLRDHHAVKIDISTALMHSPEAKEAKALEYLASVGGNVTPAERDAIQRATGLSEFVMNAESASVRRAKRMLAAVSNGNLDAAYPMPGIDNASAMAPIFQDALLSDRFNDYDEKVKAVLVNLFDYYAGAAAQEAAQAFEMQMAMAQGGGGGGAAKAAPQQQGKPPGDTRDNRGKQPQPQGE